jgi:tRNA(adenine34) deaminase
MEHETAMRLALNLAESAKGADEVPIGAVIYTDQLMLGQGHNQNIFNRDPTAHAEILALREACAYLNNYRLSAGTTLYVTLEPCPMCFYAMIHARVNTLVYGAPDPKTGYTRFFGEEQLAMFNHRIEVVPGVLAEECGTLIRDFFRDKRERGKRKWLRQSQTSP